MNINYTYASFEIGHRSWKFMVTEVASGKMHVLFKKIKPCNFVHNSRLVEPKAAAEELDEIINDANRFLQLTISKVILVIPSVGLDIVQVEKEINFEQQKKLNEYDLEIITDMASNTKNHYTNLISVFTMANHYTLDDENKFTFHPVGKHCKKISLNANIYYIDEEVYQSYLSIFEYSKAQKLDIILDVFAAGNQAATFEQLSEEAIIVDYGHVTTKIAYFQGPKITAAVGIKFGGESIDKDINYVLNSPDLSLAESLKLKFNNLLSKQEESYVIKENAFPIDKQRNKFVDFTSNDVFMIEMARIKESFFKIAAVCKEFSDNKNIPIIVSGGSANFINMEKFLKQIFPEVNISVYTPSLIGARRSDLTNVLGACYLKHLNNLEHNKKDSSVKNVLGMTYTLKQRLNFLKRKKPIFLKNLSK